MSHRKNDAIFMLACIVIILLAAAFAQRGIIGFYKRQVEVGVCSDPCPNPTLIFQGQEKYGEENVQLWMCGGAPE